MADHLTPPGLAVIGRESLTVSDSAVGLSSVPANAEAALIQNEDNNIRVDITQDPTANQGLLIASTGSLLLHTKFNLDRVKFIRATGADGQIEVLYFGARGE